jgi:hypothetical protein
VTIRNTSGIRFPGIQHKHLEVAFDGGAVTSDGGGILLRAADKRLGLLRDAAAVLDDGRQHGKCAHSAADMLRQRVFGIILGYEDLNDHNFLRREPGFQTIVGRERELASSPTLCRFENRHNRQSAIQLNKLFVERFVKSFEKPPKELILDFDTKATVTHGEQEGRHFHAHYDEYCMLPLYVFCGRQLLVSYLRPSKWDNALHSAAILKLLVRRLRQEWPDVKIVFRADSGFCRSHLLHWCDRRGVDYIVGLAKNSRVEESGRDAMQKAERRFKKSGQKSRAFDHFGYKARKWKHARKVIIRAEHSDYGSNPRFIVTSLTGISKNLYEDVYCARGEMENRIKEQVGLFCDRVSATEWWANQFRLLLSGLAYSLVEGLRSIALGNTTLAKAQPETLRTRLFKIGAVVTSNSRRIIFHMSAACPWQRDFIKIAGAFSTA